MAGITRYGSYLPYNRLQRAAMGAGKGERTVGSYDEDAVSMGVEAARDAVRGASGIDSLIFATTSPPYAEKLNAATLAAALDLPKTVRSLELGASTRMGSGRAARRRGRGLGRGPRAGRGRRRGDRRAGRRTREWKR